MNFFVEKISPGPPESNKIMYMISMNSLKGESLCAHSELTLKSYLDKDEIKDLTLPELHQLIIEYGKKTIERFLDEYSFADMRSGC